MRISKIKRTFEKGYLPNFSKEIFTISKQIPQNPVVHKLKDYDGEELKGTAKSHQTGRRLRSGKDFEEMGEGQKHKTSCKMVRVS